MSDTPKEGKGPIRRYFSVLGRAAGGALGGEFVTAGKAVLHGTQQQLKSKTCPRCFEKSVLQQDDGLLHCSRTDICGWSGTEAQLKSLEGERGNIHPYVYALAKGGQLPSASKAGSVNSFFSWALWGLAVLIFSYALSWLIDGRFFYAGWVALVSLLVSIYAVQFAYRAQVLKGRFSGSPAGFLKRADLWFVLS